jgi:hypothetical protein
MYGDNLYKKEDGTNIGTETKEAKADVFALLGSLKT